MIWEAFQQEPTVQTIFSDWLWKATTLICNKLLLTDVNPGGGKGGGGGGEVQYETDGDACRLA